MIKTWRYTYAFQALIKLVQSLLNIEIKKRAMGLKQDET